jgi:4-hydroxy-tetrahydrodipicolinate reductase
MTTIQPPVPGTRRRVIIWGPGALGQACIREIVKMPELELVGVLAFSPEKDGVDAAELVGLPSIGVSVTTDKDKIVELDADVVMHCAAAIPDLRAYDEDVIRLLESGKNVISAAAYFYPQAHGADYAAVLQSACEKGEVSLHGTGVNPGLLLERMAVTATALSNRVSFIRGREATECRRVQSTAFMTAFGFGQHPGDVDAENGPVAELTNRYFKEALEFLSITVYGRPLDRIERKHHFTVAEEDFDVASMTIKKGHISTVQYVYEGIIDETPRIRLEQHWYQLPEHKTVPDATSGHYMDVEVEGQPCSMRLRFDTFASARDESDRIEGDPTMLTFYAVAALMFQAIPVTCAAPPGLLAPTVFAHHRPDYSA